MAEQVPHYTVHYLAGEELTGTAAELADIEGSERYNLAKIAIGNTGFECVFDDRRAGATDLLLNIADKISKATSNCDEVISVLDDAHGLILDMAKYMEPEVLQRSDVFNRLIAVMPSLVEKLGGEPTRKYIK